jgi:agmatine deiminase
MSKLTSSPTTDGYFMPPEYAPHDGTLMLLPFRGDVWRNQGKDARACFLKIAQAIAEFEPVFVGVHPSLFTEYKTLTLPNITFFECDSDDAWVRDVGPTFLVNQQGDVRSVDWTFNAYGGAEHGLYSPWNKDDQVASFISNHFNIDYYRIDQLVMEGGAFHIDENGLVIATEYNLLHPGRNPRLQKERIEKELLHALGGQKLIWLPRGIYNDETKEHVDNVATFIGPGHVLLAYATDVRDAQQPLSEKTMNALKLATDLQGNPLKITTITMPKAIHRTYFESAALTTVKASKNRPMNERLAASYLNLYFVNGGVIVPKFNQKFDEIAREQLTAAFPDRKVVMLDTKEVLLGGGNIHCITQQIPQGALRYGPYQHQSRRDSNGDVTQAKR